MRVFFDRELDNVATFWRVFRKDGVALGFTSHDRDLLLSGIHHRAAPGMASAAIKLTNALSGDSAEVEGALTHDAISKADLSAGLYDEAGIAIGAVDWETLDHEVLYAGQIGQVEDDRHSFSAQLRSAKHILEQDLVPRTSPTCRAVFCGRGCSLSATRFTSWQTLVSLDVDTNRIEIAQPIGLKAIDGRVRFLDGPQTGMVFGVTNVEGNWLTLDRALSPKTPVGIMLELLEGCDHTLATCANRFDNAVNFRGEPFLPGNDLLARYGRPNE